MRTLFVVTAALLAAFVLAAACFEGRGACAQEEPGIVTGVPWFDQERAEYVLLDRDSGEECGAGALTVARQGERFELTLRFEGQGNSDTSTVLVDGETLRPVSIRRERVVDGETEIVEGEYDRAEGVIRVVEILDGEPRTVPRSLDEESYYDNESSLFLWRTIRFEEGYEASYNAVLVNQGGAQRSVTLRVVEKEEVTVPAGTFQAWRVEIKAGGVDQIAWFADTPEHPLVYYDNSVLVFQLTSFEP